MPEAAPEILPIGTFYPLDAAGCVRNRCAMAHVAGDWKVLAEAAVDLCRQRLGARLRAVYLRGSVPAGTAIAGLSDLDVVALCAPEPGAFQRWDSPAWAAEVSRHLLARHPVAHAIDWAVADHDPAVPGRNPRVKMVLQTQALCLWGQNPFAEQPQAYRPGPDMCLHYRWLDSDLAAWRAAVQADTATTSLLRSLLKTMVRTGFELVMEAEGQFATDLYPCWQAFGKHFPAQKAEMAEAIRIFLAPELAATRLNPLLSGLAPWLSAQCLRQFPLNSPAH